MTNASTASIVPLLGSGTDIATGTDTGDDARASKPAALLALDWGSTQLRAFLMDRAGAVLAQRSLPRGLTQLSEPGPAGFDAALDEIAGDWLAGAAGLPVLACGMVGSAQGWREASYVRCPAQLGELAFGAVRAPSRVAGEVWITPGLVREGRGSGVDERGPARADSGRASVRPANEGNSEPRGESTPCVDSDPQAAANAGIELPDVMRGEETQIIGALAQQAGLREAACIILPGTHAKWALIADSSVHDFRSFMTGELYAVLRQHSLLGRLMPSAAENPPGDEDAAARTGFSLGLRLARESQAGDLSHQLFGTRTLGLRGQLPPAALASYLSGLLIGHELRSGLAFRARSPRPQAPLVLVGEPALCARYAEAFQAFGEPSPTVLSNTAPAGLHALFLGHSARPRQG